MEGKPEIRILVENTERPVMTQQTGCPFSVIGAKCEAVRGDLIESGAADKGLPDLLRKGSQHLLFEKGVQCGDVAALDASPQGAFPVSRVDPVDIVKEKNIPPYPALNERICPGDGFFIYLRPREGGEKRGQFGRGIREVLLVNFDDLFFGPVFIQKSGKRCPGE